LVNKNRKINLDEVKELSRKALKKNESILRALAAYDMDQVLPASRLWIDVLTPKVKFSKNFGSGAIVLFGQSNPIETSTGSTVVDRQLGLVSSVSV
jgi:hypothetical protein